MDARNFDPIFTNSRIYREIALDAQRLAHDEMHRLRTPRADGADGHVIAHDPDRVSFKQAMIAIVFAGMYMESWLWLTGTRLLGIDAYEPIDRLALEKRIAPLGIEDQSLHDSLKAFREVRKDLVHEKAVRFSMDKSPSRTAQPEAEKAVALMLRLEEVLAEKVDLMKPAT